MEEVLDKPELLSVPTIEELRDYSTPYYRRIPWSFMVLYPELVIKKVVSSTMVHSQEDFTAIWPEFYQLFNWETYNRYPWWRRKIPYWLLIHQPQFAELIPINWKKAKQNDIFLINQHQKFERYIKPELFSQDDFRKILHLRPEYAKFADMQNITGRKLVDDICKKENIKRKKLFELIAANKDPKLGFTCSVRLFAITYMHNIILKHGLYKDKSVTPLNTDYKNIFNTISNMN